MEGGNREAPIRGTPNWVLAIALCALVFWWPFSLPSAESALQFKKGSFAKNTVVGTQAITGLGFPPKAVVFFWTRQTATDTFNPNISAGYGFATGPANERSIAIASRDGIFGGDTAKGQWQSYSIVLFGSTADPTPVAQAELVSLDGNGFTLNWTLNEARADIIHYIALAGTDIVNAKVDSFVKTTGTGNLPVTGVGFKPDFVMFLAAHTTAPDVNTTEGQVAIGFASSPTERGALGVQLEDADGFTRGTCSWQRADRVLLELNDTCAPDTEFDFVSFDSDGFTVNRILNNNDTRVVHYLALQGGKYKVGTFDKTSSSPPPIDQAVAGVGFAPVGLMLASKNRVTNLADETNARLSLGAGDGTTEGATWWHDEHAITSDNNQRTTTGKIALHGSGAGAGTVDAEADLKSLDTNGFTLTWTTNSNLAAHEILYVAFGGSTNYRSIGTAPDYTTGSVGAATGSAIITGAGTTWKTANRGRGDRILIDGTNYTVLSVDSDTQLTLTSPFTGVSGAGKAYTIARQFATPASWEDCVDGGAGTCAPFPDNTASLVADNRSEVGVVYDDGISYGGGLVIDGSVTDATHTLTLTADGDNRHYGIPGSGVVIDNGASVTSAIRLLDNYATVEWMEITGTGLGAYGIEVDAIDPASRILLRNNIIHIPGFGIGLLDKDQVTDVYNNIAYSCDIGIRVATNLETWTQIRLFNNTLYDNVTYGINSSASINPQQLTLQNNLAASNGTDFTLNAPANAASSNNLSTDSTAATATVSPGGGGQANVPLSGAGGINFVDDTLPTVDLHLQTTSFAIDKGADLSGTFAFDIDGGARATPWDIGADDTLATTEVVLVSFEARGVDSAVELTWETASELSNLGFHLHRATSAEGPYQRVTARVIPGLGSSPVGAKYRYLDSGLVNGASYFYKLEDVETTGNTTFHGPVSAAPSAVGASPGSGPSTRITYGRPEANGFRELERTSQGVLLELVTEGFFAEPQEDGSLRLEIPGFEPRDSSPSVPLLRPWVDVASRREVAIASIRETSVSSFGGLRPSGADLREVVASLQGAVRARRGGTRAFRETESLVPEESARLLQVGFHGEAKKAQLEMAPLRWSGSTGELLLARRLTVRLVFRGVAREEHREKPAHRKPAAVVRLVTTEKGLHEASYEALFPGRPGRRGVTTDSLRLSRQGKAVGFHVDPQGARFVPGSRLYFLSEGAEANPYGSEAVYELEWSGGGVSMEVGSAAPIGEPTPSYVQVDDYEENRFYQAGLLEAPDLWLWDVLMAPAAKSFGFRVRGLASGPSRLTVRLQGVSDFASEPDHHVRLSVNGIFQNELTWDGKESRTIELVVPEGGLREGENHLEIANVGDTDAPYSMVMLDRFQVAYPRVVSGEGGRLEGLWTHSGTVSVELGASHLLDVTEGTPRWLSGAEVSFERTLRFRAEAGRRYLAVSREAVLRPLARSVARARLKKETLQADYLVVGPSDFASAALPLLEHRSRQGLRVKFAALEDVYSEFGFGEARPEAIREFLSYAYHHWQGPRLRYVLLLGDATYDFKDYLETGVQNQLPPLMVKTSYLWTASDPTLAAVHGDDLLSDLAIGRLPAQNAEELRVIVSKILAYETGGAPSESLLVLVNDNPDRAGDFASNAEEIESGVLSGRSIRRLSLEELGGAMRSEILRAFDEGPSLVSYIGHGGIHLWADENVLNTSDVASLSPQTQQPLLLTMNCLNGYFHFPYFDSLSEALLKAEGKGAIAAFSPSGLSLNEPAHRFHQAILGELFNRGHERLGDALVAAQEAYAATGVFPELLSIYHLLGDPALVLR